MQYSGSEGLNRRQSVRVTDRILLSYKQVSEELFQEIAKDFKVGISLYNQERVAGIQLLVGAQNALARLRERDTDLADFLQHIDTKLNLVLKKIQEEKLPFDDLVMQKATLSGTGISFYADQQFSVGDILDFHIVLLPSYTYIYCFGKIVSCDGADDKGGEEACRVAAEFILVTEEDREKMIQHNFKQQSLALRNRRLNQDI